MTAQAMVDVVIFKCRAVIVGGPDISVDTDDGGYIYYPEGPISTGTNVEVARTAAGIYTITFPRLLSLSEDSVKVQGLGTGADGSDIGADAVFGSADVSFSGGTAPQFTVITIQTWSISLNTAGAPPSASVEALETGFWLKITRTPGIGG